MAKIDFESIKQEYITGSASLRDLAKKHKISQRGIGQRSISEGWAESRKRFRLKRASEIQSATIADDVEKALQFKAKERGVYELAFEGIRRKMLTKAGEFNTKIKPRDLRHLVQSLQSVQAMMYRSLGIPDKQEVSIPGGLEVVFRNKTKD